MYVIKADGQVVYSPALSDAQHQVISPSLSLQLNKAGSLSFILPPGHAMWDKIQKMKSIITVEQDGEEIFRGRALDEATDFYNQKEVYCEGELSFLLDSLQRPYRYEGTVENFLRMMLDNHNAQVEAEKRFSVGIVTAADGIQLALENIGYSDTLTALENVLLNDYKGYFRIRFADGVRYLDYLKEYEESCGQKIEFGVNLLDMENQINAKEIFTVLVPLGAILDDGSTLTIESVNEGLDYIESAEGIAKYGRIIKTHSWEHVTNAAELYMLGFDMLNNASTAETMTIKAVDLHLLNGSTDKISLGDTVRLVSAPHNLNRDYICTFIELKPFNPEETMYTFGPKRDTLADSAASMAIKLKSNSEDLFCHLRHIKELEKAVNINIINIDDTFHRLSAVEVDIDAVQAEIALKASQYEVSELGFRITSAEALIDGANAEIELKVSKNEVVSSINQTSEEIKIQASKINLDGYVTASRLNAEIASVNSAISTSIVTSSLSASTVSCSTLTVTDASFRPKTLNYTDADGNAASMVVLAM